MFTLKWQQSSCKHEHFLPFACHAIFVNHALNTLQALHHLNMEEIHNCTVKI